MNTNISPAGSSAAGDDFIHVRAMVVATGGTVDFYRLMNDVYASTSRVIFARKISTKCICIRFEFACSFIHFFQFPNYSTSGDSF